MSTTWANVSPVFCALADGTLPEKAEGFADDQIRPFLPLLIAQAFHDISDELNDRLMARVSSFVEGNRILRLLNAVDFSQIERDVVAQKRFPEHFTFASDETKIKIVLYAFIFEDHREEDSLLVELLSEDKFEEAMFLFQIGFLKLAHLIHIEKFTLRMLMTPNGSRIILSLLCVAPELLQPILNVLKGMKVAEETPKGRQKAALLGQLFVLQPGVAWNTLNELARTRRDCLLAVRLACDLLPDADVVAFLVFQLLHRETDTLICQMITRSNARPTLIAIYDRLIAIGKAVLRENSMEPLTDVVRLIAFLQQHCVARLSPDQLQALCGLVCRQNVGDDVHIVISTVILMAIQAFTLMQHQAGVINTVDERIPAFFRYLKQFVKDPSRRHLSHNLIYIATCVYSGKKDLLAAMFSDLLRTKMSVMPRHLDALTTIIRENFLSMDEVSQECKALPVSKGLNAYSGTRLPLNAIYTCFVAHAIDITAWMEAQLQTCSFPVHPLLPELIERFASWAVMTKRAGLNKEFIRRTFEGELVDESKLVQRVLSFLFLLSYRSNLDQLGPKAFEVHSADVFSKLPIRYLLSIVTCRNEQFGAVQSALFRLATDIFPFMLPTVDSVKTLKEKRRSIPMDISAEMLSALLKTNDGLITVTRKLQHAPISEQVACLKIVLDAFMRSLDVQHPIPVVESVVALYCRVENIVPRMLYEASALEWVGRVGVSLRDLYEYPSLLFRCDRRILSSPPHFRCFLRILEFFTASAKNNLMRRIHTVNSNTQNDQDKADREVLSTAYDHTQMSLLVQLLVEVSDEKRMKDDPSDEGALRRRCKIRTYACELIHQIFIGDKNLMRLVLFQGLPLHLVPHLVDQIPCMYVANEFIQEMLSLPDLNRRIFGICLMVHIARKYRIATYCQSVEMVLDVLHTLLRFAESNLNVRLFLKVTPTLAQVTSIFPQLAGDVTELLLRVSTLAKARLCLQPMMIRPNCEERQLLAVISKSLSEQIDLVAW